MGSELVHDSGLRARDTSIGQQPDLPTPAVASNTAAAHPPPFSYDLYCDQHGHFTYDGAARELVKWPSHLQRVYADVTRGEARSKQLVQELEYWFQHTGIALADRTAALGCRVLPELQANCRPPNWDLLDQLLGNTPECVRLREVLMEAYARRAHQLGVRNDIIVAGANLLLAASLAEGVLARAGVVETQTSLQRSLASEAEAAEVAGRGGTKLKPDPAAQGAHTTFKRNAQTGKVTGYAEWQPNPRNPSGFDQAKRVDVRGDPHFNKTTGQDVPTPHVHDKGVPGGVRPAQPGEVPQ